MSSPKQVTAIFDIGKTNKKFLLFDEKYAVIEKHQTELEESTDDDGDSCEDLAKLTDWIKDQISEANKRYDIQAMNFSAYGASLVHLDKNGEPVTDLYNYLKNYPDELLSEFYESAGGKETFSLQTASPPMGMLNSGLQLYWLKHRKPGLFSSIETSLHFPNYLSYLFTGRKVSELTSIGCHTGLWDFDKMNYHQWVDREEVRNLLPSPKAISEFSVNDQDIKVGPGIHDSSAALAPYLMGMNDSFLLVSTGTWSITLNPFNDEPLTYEELERDCLCYLDIYGNQVKASRFFLGAEYSHQKKKIEDFFGESVDENSSAFDVALMKETIKNRKSGQGLDLEKAYSSGPFPQEKQGDWQLDQFSSAKEAYNQLVLDLVYIQSESIKLAEGNNKIGKLIVTGGFSQNVLFLSLLATFFEDKEIYTSSLPNASALGAALVVNEESVIRNEVEQSHVSKLESHLGQTSPDKSRDLDDIKKLLDLKLVKPLGNLNLENYSWV
ncbi:FGGY-family carbohydrate kinase [Rhodohalobacter sp. 614A]|uniref:FGGY-family carbohydrate kinase n=1 Tax=Rhodohalobacter sp. 614A TaxID=2908649 RepID=UPI001EFF2F69|nr:FGGY family carbohydrate kinase [Rhodohalobacter sp. 614A]